MAPDYELARLMVRGVAALPTAGCVGIRSALEGVGAGALNLTAGINLHSNKHNTTWIARAIVTQMTQGSRVLVVLILEVARGMRRLIGL